MCDSGNYRCPEWQQEADRVFALLEEVQTKSIGAAQVGARRFPLERCSGEVDHGVGPEQLPSARKLCRSYPASGQEAVAAGGAHV